MNEDLPDLREWNECFVRPLHTLNHALQIIHKKLSRLRTHSGSRRFGWNQRATVSAPSNPIDSYYPRDIMVRD